jgi:hypothetical protein
MSTLVTVTVVESVVATWRRKKRKGKKETEQSELPSVTSELTHDRETVCVVYIRIESVPDVCSRSCMQFAV